ncbi:MAG: hypothetical protein RIS45_1756 [Planctomycetota bacterium]
MNQHMRRLGRSLLHLLPLLLAAASAHAQDAVAGSEAVQPSRDRYLVKVAVLNDAEPSAAPRSAGRLLLFFTPATERWSGVEPCEAPFFSKLQPLASVAAAPASEGTVYTIDDTVAAVFGRPLDELKGTWRVQAVLDSDFTTRGHLGPGNLASEVKVIELSPDDGDEIRLELTRRIEAPTPPANAQVVWIERRSELLSKHFGRPFDLRAGVVLPFGYDDLAFPRRMWPAIYVIGGYGATHLAAASAASALQTPAARGAIPQAVWVFLDTETAWGHHGFCDSETNGPVGRALVEELVPFLEERFRVIAKPEARVVTGHSSGGWTALHLTLAYPAVFGACFSSAPDPVDFSAFQRSDLYRDASLFLARDGTETPSYREPLGPKEDRVLMSVRAEITTERVLDPVGRSGQQWAAWDAMWSPFDALRGAPRPICDATTGAIDPVTAEAWSRHDIAREFERDRARVGALFAERIRLVCGTRDSYYLNEAVARLKSKIDAWRASEVARGATPPAGPGYIELLEGLTHGTCQAASQLRFYQEIREHFLANGLAEPLPRPAAESSSSKP